MTEAIFCAGVVNKPTNLPLISSNVGNEAKKLIVQSFDFEIKTEQPQEKKERNFEEITKKVPEEFFAPCIKKGLEGLEDGRKRFVFTMVNFLRCVGWPYEDIEVRLKEWNKKNQEELREIYIISYNKYKRYIDSFNPKI